MDIFLNLLDFLKISVQQSQTEHKINAQIKEHDIPKEIGSGKYRLVHICPWAKILFLNGHINKNFRYKANDKNLLSIKFFTEIENILGDVSPLNTNKIYFNIGYNGLSKTNFKEKTKLNGLYIFISLNYYNSYLLNRFPGQNFPIKDAISSLTNGCSNPNLLKILKELKDYNCESPSSILFYECKLNEFIFTLINQLNNDNITRKTTVKKTDADAVKKIAEYINSNPSKNINMDELAKISCMSTAKLKYVFKAVYSMSLRDYKISTRMNYAKKMLTKTEESIGNIAKELGYKSSSSFSDTFKNQCGITPKQYRNITKKL